MCSGILLWFSVAFPWWPIMVSIISCVYLLFMIFWWSICSDLSSIFQLGCFHIAGFLKIFVYILYKSLLRYKIGVLQIFSANLWLVFSFSQKHLHSTELLILDFNKVKCIIFSQIRILVLDIKTHNQTQGHPDFLPFFF